jgi:hypothetical protein
LVFTDVDGSTRLLGERPNVRPLDRAPCGPESMLSARPRAALTSRRHRRIAPRGARTRKRWDQVSFVWSCIDGRLKVVVAEVIWEPGFGLEVGKARSLDVFNDRYGLHAQRRRRVGVSPGRDECPRLVAEACRRRGRVAGEHECGCRGIVQLEVARALKLERKRLGAE